jgi:hypothetical protein
MGFRLENYSKKYPKKVCEIWLFDTFCNPAKHAKFVDTGKKIDDLGSQNPLNFRE